MKTTMITVRQKRKIANLIVGLIAINVMYVLSCGKLSSQASLHHYAMLKNDLTVNCDLPVSITSNPTLSIGVLEPLEGVAVSDQSLIVDTAIPATTGASFASLDLAEIGFEVLDETSSILILDHAVHNLSPSPKVSLISMGCKRNGGKHRVNCWKPLRADNATTQPETANVKARKIVGLGNQQPSLGYILGRFNDYRRGLVPLITGFSARPEREDIVYTAPRGVGSSSSSPILTGLV